MTSSAHTTLAKRLLSPNKDLPPLLVSPRAIPELNAELYDFVALSLRAFVNPWWSKITRYDKEFLPDLTRILVQTFRVLERRIIAADLPALVFLDIPTIVLMHCRDHRIAAEKVSTSYASGGAASLAQMFHHAQPHMAISAEGQLDREYYRQIFDVVLENCLPIEDYEAEAERYIVKEIMVKVLVDDVIPKITQPWFIQRLILDHLGAGREQREPHLPEPPSSTTSYNSFSFHTIIVIILSTIQSISGACLALIHTYKQTMGTIKRVNQSHPPTLIPSARRAVKRVSEVVCENNPLEEDFTLLPPVHISTTAHEPLGYAMPPTRMLAEVFTFNDRLSSSVLITLLNILATFFSSFLDKLLPHMLYNFLSPAFLLNTTRAAKRTLFPNGYPGPPPPDPTPEEQAETKARLIAWRPQGVLAYAIPWILGPNPSGVLNAALSPFDDQVCNTHLVVLLLDRVFCVLFPELVGERIRSEV